MAFERIWPEEVHRILTARVVDSDDSVRAVHELAEAGAIRGIDPEQVPPLKTLASWATDERRARETAEAMGTVEGVVGTLEQVHGIAAAKLLVDAKALAEKRPRAKPAEWAEMGKAIAELAKARRALEGPAPKTAGKPAAAPAQGETPDASASFLASLDPDAT